MKTLVTYYSATGNTERLALAIYDEIAGEKCLLKLSEVTSINEYDLVFVGFPIYNFGPVPQAIEFIKKYAHNKYLALFTTMSLKAAPESEQTRKLYDTTIKNCKECSGNANLLGVFDCPGELSESAANALLKSEDPMLQLFGSMRPLSIGYPTEKNISDVRHFVKSISSTFGKVKQQINYG